MKGKTTEKILSFTKSTEPEKPQTDLEKATTQVSDILRKLNPPISTPFAYNSTKLNNEAKFLIGNENIEIFVYPIE